MNKSLPNQNHPYHMVSTSPWPLLLSLSIMYFLLGAISWFYDLNTNQIIMSFLLILLNMMQWWRDIIRESTFQGNHTSKVSKLIRMGMILFILSEILFFFSFFWTYFHMSLSPSIEIGSNWPPNFIMSFNPYNTPLLNTIVLLSSGITITWSHYSILNKNFNESMNSLIITILLGIYFTFLQFTEYKEASFSISDSIYGSSFFLITGFHGIHVMIGSIFIMIMTLRLNKNQFSQLHHFGFEASSWYWHFVDVIWLFVYIFIYWWSF